MMKIMFNFLILLAFTPVLMGCPSEMVPDKEALVTELSGNATAGAGLKVIATLASVDTLEWVAAPAYNRLAGYRLRAASMLRAGAIDVRQAQDVLYFSDNLRSRLDDAVENNEKFRVVLISDSVDAAMMHLTEIGRR